MVKPCGYEFIDSGYLANATDDTLSDSLYNLFISKKVHFENENAHNIFCRALFSPYKKVSKD